MIGRAEKHLNGTHKAYELLLLSSRYLIVIFTVYSINLIGATKKQGPRSQWRMADGMSENIEQGVPELLITRRGHPNT